MIPAGTDTERQAWQWLLALPRLDWRKHGFRKTDQQVMIRICPGRLGALSGAPLIHVHVSFPGLKARIRGTGNNLYHAVERIHHYLWEKGIHLPFVWQTENINYPMEQEYDPARTRGSV